MYQYLNDAIKSYDTEEITWYKNIAVTCMQEEVRIQYSSSDSQRRALSTQALSLIIPKTMKLVFVSSPLNMQS